VLEKVTEETRSILLHTGVSLKLTIIESEEEVATKTLKLDQAKLNISMKKRNIEGKKYQVASFQKCYLPYRRFAFVGQDS
jgi:hypothetical protein